MGVLDELRGKMGITGKGQGNKKGEEQGREGRITLFTESIVAYTSVSGSL